MMRERKFKAWDNVNKCFADWHKTFRDAECDPDNDYDYKKLFLYVSQDGHVLEDTFEHGICDYHYYLQGKTKYTLIDYIGLHNKQGGEMYEGDILGGVWGDCYIGYCEKCKSFELIAKDFGCMSCQGDVKWQELVEDDGKMEVIGNIYENEELLK